MASTHILYNDRCPICRAEIRHYRARAEKSAAPLRFQDLNEVDLSRWSMTPEQAMRRLHARTPDGGIVSGVDAFALIWKHLPGYRWLATLVGLKAVRPLAGFAYDRIAAPWLYRRNLRRMALEEAGTRP